MRWTIKI